MSKSHVSMEQKVCPVTGKTFDSGGILLETRIDRKTNQLKQSLERNTVTGWEISPEVQEKIDEGFIPLVGIDEAKSTKLENGNISPDGAWRTGRIAYLKRTAWANIFNVPEPSELFIFVDDQIITMLNEQDPSEEEE